jgi:hypothetical protein
MTTRPDRISFGESVTDLGRGLLSAILVILLLIPAVVIRLTDWLTLRWIRRKGGLN